MLVKHGLFLGGRRTGKIEREGGSFGGGGGRCFPRVPWSISFQSVCVS